MKTIIDSVQFVINRFHNGFVESHQKGNGFDLYLDGDFDDYEYFMEELGEFLPSHATFTNELMDDGRCHIKVERKMGSVNFIIVPKDNGLPIMKCAIYDCISSTGEHYSRGMTCWTHQGHDDNPFYHYNESIKFAEKQLGGQLVWNPYDHYQYILEEYSQVWREIAEEIMANRDEQVTMKFKHFKIVSNVDTSILTY